MCKFIVKKDEDWANKNINDILHNYLQPNKKYSTKNSLISKIFSFY